MKTYRETNHNLNYKDQASTILNIPKERSTDVSDVYQWFYDITSGGQSVFMVILSR